MDTISKKLLNNQKEGVIIVNNLQDRKLSSEYYLQGVVELARSLVGKIIVRDLPEGQIQVVIVETEAYKAPEDKACHAYNNKRTERTKYFWQDGGHLYVYNIYGPQNNCINITASDKDHPEAVLIRAVEPLVGLDIIKSNRKTVCKRVYDLTNGPGKVGMALGIDKTHNGFNLTTGVGCYLIDNKLEFQVEESKRINIQYAEEWIDKLWRFTMKDNKYVSKGK